MTTCSGQQSIFPLLLWITSTLWAVLALLLGHPHHLSLWIKLSFSESCVLPFSGSHNHTSPSPRILSASVSVGDALGHILCLWVTFSLGHTVFLVQTLCVFLSVALPLSGSLSVSDSRCVSVSHLFLSYALSGSCYLTHSLSL